MISIRDNQIMNNYEDEVKIKRILVKLLFGIGILTTIVAFILGYFFTRDAIRQGEPAFTTMDERIGK